MREGDVGGGGGGGGVNITLEEYLWAARGPKQLPLAVVVPVTVVYAFIAATGVAGNVVVCVVIARTPKLHTATNYYLFSLAVSDLLLLLLGLPHDLSVFWQQYPWKMGEAMCKARAVISEMVSYSSVLTVVAFSAERYVAVCRPLRARSLKGLPLRRAPRAIAALWLVALAAAAPFAVYTTVHYIDYPPGSGKIVEESGFCAMLIENIPAKYPVYELSSVLFFFLPLLAMIFLYTRMALTLWRPQNVGQSVEGSTQQESRRIQKRKSIIKMLAAVVVAFFLCWAPFHLQRLLYIYGRNSPNYLKVNEWMYYITGCFYYFSATINPVLYNVMSAKYREAFFKTLCCIHEPTRYHDHSSYQETAICYANSSSGHRRNLSRYSHCSGYQEGEITVKDNDEIGSYFDLSNNNLTDNFQPDVIVVASNDKTESFLNHKTTNSRNWYRNSVFEEGNLEKNGQESLARMCMLGRACMRPQETCI